MKFAVIRVFGKQYLVKEGGQIEIAGLSGDVGKPLSLSEVLLVSNDSGLKIGTPFVDKAVVKTEIVSSGLGPKLHIAKFKAKSRYRRTQGFRPRQTILKITKIGEEESVKKTARKA